MIHPSKYTVWRESQLSAYHTSILTIPKVITNCCPGQPSAHLHTSSRVGVGATQSDFPFRTGFLQVNRRNFHVHKSGMREYTKLIPDSDCIQSTHQAEVLLILHNPRYDESYYMVLGWETGMTQISQTVIYAGFQTHYMESRLHYFHN